MSESLPLFPLGAVLFPGMVFPLHIFEQRYRKMFAERAESDPIFGIVLTRSGREVGEQPEIHQVGTGASLLNAVRHSDGRVDLAVQGGERFHVLDSHWDRGVLTAQVEWFAGNRSGLQSDEAARLSRAVKRAFAAYLDVLERVADVHIERVDFQSDPVDVAFTICSIMPLDLPKKQQLLEAKTSVDLLGQLLATLRRERELLKSTGVGGDSINHPGSRFSLN